MFLEHCFAWINAKFQCLELVYLYIISLLTVYLPFFLYSYRLQEEEIKRMAEMKRREKLEDKLAR